MLQEREESSLVEEFSLLLNTLRTGGVI